MAEEQLVQLGLVDEREVFCRLVLGAEFSTKEEQLVASSIGMVMLEQIRRARDEQGMIGGVNLKLPARAVEILINIISRGIDRHPFTQDERRVIDRIATQLIEGTRVSPAAGN